MAKKLTVKQKAARKRAARKAAKEAMKRAKFWRLVAAGAAAIRTATRPTALQRKALLEYLRRGARS